MKKHYYNFSLEKLDQLQITVGGFWGMIEELAKDYQKVAKVNGVANNKINFVRIVEENGVQRFQMESENHDKE